MKNLVKTLLLLAMISPVFASEQTDLSQEQMDIQTMMKKIEKQERRVELICQNNRESSIKFFKGISPVHYSLYANNLVSIADTISDELSNGFYNELSIGLFDEVSPEFDEMSITFYEENKSFVSCLSILAIHYYQVAKLMEEFSSDNTYYILKLRAKLLAEKGSEYFSTGVDAVVEKADGLLDEAVEFTKENMTKLQKKIKE